MAETPHRSLPVIDEQMVVRWRLGYLIAFVSSLIGGAIFCTTLWIKVDRLSEDVAEMKSWMRGQPITRASP